MTGLHWSVYKNHENITRFLLKNGCQPNATDNLGRTPLYFAAFINSSMLVKVDLKIIEF